jgi:hypothetical protein
MTRLGSKLPFQEAADELAAGYHTAISEPTCRRTTHRSGHAAEAIACAEVERLEKEAPDPAATPDKLLVSADGSYIHLTNGNWQEVKSVATGEFESEEQTTGAEKPVKTTAISYFTRSYEIRDFERYALGELHRRGLEKAQTVVAVNDGAQWIQSFIDYHCPQAVRIIDFAHALSYVSDAGKAIWDEGSDAFKTWFTRMAHQLKHKPPQRTLAELQLLQPKAKTDKQAAMLDRAIFYLQTRLEMIDYPFFQKRGHPIGSGSVESGHKVVVQRRLKGAGMRWAPHNVDPMLALRDLVCNHRWSEGWSQIVAYQQKQKRRKRVTTVSVKEKPGPEAVTFAKLKAAGLLPAEKRPEKTSDRKTTCRPADDHPWRNDIWPTKESWRWN